MTIKNLDVLTYHAGFHTPDRIIAEVDKKDSLDSIVLDLVDSIKSNEMGENVVFRHPCHPCKKCKVCIKHQALCNDNKRFNNEFTDKAYVNNGGYLNVKDKYGAFILHQPLEGKKEKNILYGIKRQGNKVYGQIIASNAPDEDVRLVDLEKNGTIKYYKDTPKDTDEILIKEYNSYTGSGNYKYNLNILKNAVNLSNPNKKSKLKELLSFLGGKNEK